MRTANLLVALAAIVALFVTGCGRGNGLPADITGHLAAKGITVRVERAHAPLSSRAGYLVTRHDPELLAGLVSAFKLEPIGADDPRWPFATNRAGGATAASEVWGLSGRPSQFGLKNGAQFEYFYTVITSDGWMFLVAEYAYG